MNKTKNITKIKASKLRLGDMVRSETSGEFNGIIEINDDGTFTRYIVLSNGHERDFRMKETVEAIQKVQNMTKADHKKAIKKLANELDRITAALAEHEKALLSLKVAKSRTKIFTVKKAYEVLLGDQIDSEEFPAGFKKVVNMSDDDDDIRFYFSDGNELQVGERDPVLVKTKAKASK